MTKEGDRETLEKMARRAEGRGDRLEATDYIFSAVADLALVARRHELDTLAYLLDMAKLEADEVRRLLSGR